MDNCDTLPMTQQIEDFEDGEANVNVVEDLENSDEDIFEGILGKTFLDDDEEDEEAIFVSANDSFSDQRNGILYGQTPKTIQDRDFADMSKFFGYSEIEDFSRFVLNLDFNEKVDLLREFYATKNDKAEEMYDEVKRTYAKEKEELEAEIEAENEEVEDSRAVVSPEKCVKRKGKSVKKVSKPNVKNDEPLKVSVDPINCEEIPVIQNEVSSQEQSDSWRKRPSKPAPPSKYKRRRR